MSRRSDREFLLDILEAIRRIEMYTKGMDFQDFLQKLETQDAVLRNLEIIGEAVKNLSTSFKKNYKDIPWKIIAGMRDKIIHFYFGVNLDIVWHTIKNELPKINKRLQNILDEIR